MVSGAGRSDTRRSDRALLARFRTVRVGGLGEPTGEPGGLLRPEVISPIRGDQLVSSVRRVSGSRWEVSVATSCATYSEISPLASSPKVSGSSWMRSRARVSLRTPCQPLVLVASPTCSPIPAPAGGS